jgi:hypothetical protein
MQNLARNISVSRVQFPQNELEVPMLLSVKSYIVRNTVICAGKLITIQMVFSSFPIGVFFNDAA